MLIVAGVSACVWLALLLWANVRWRACEVEVAWCLPHGNREPRLSLIGGLTPVVGRILNTILKSIKNSPTVAIAHGKENRSYLGLVRWLSS